VIFNVSIHEGFVSAHWKEANIIPVPKLHLARSIESDFRPISLTSTLGTLLELFIGNWILKRIKLKLDDQQYGALNGRSATQALVNMLHHWHSTVDKGQLVHTVFIDFAKAFDHVDHSMLVVKLEAFGLSDTVVQWTVSFLVKRRQQVKIGDVLSEWLEVFSGMPQDSFLGLLTFIILIDCHFKAPASGHPVVTAFSFEMSKPC